MIPAPLLHWQLDDIAPGNVIVDYAPAQRDGRTEGNPTVAADDRFGAVVVLDGDGDALVSPALPPTPTYTMAAWVRVTRPTGPVTPVLGRISAALRLSADGTLATDTRTVQGALRAQTGPGIFTFDEWHHVAVVRDTGTLRTYLDGVEVSNVNVPSPLPVEGPVVVGREPGIGSGHRKMAVSALRLFDTALDPGQVAELVSADGSTVAAFARTHPLDFALANADDQPVLYINDAATDQILTLRVTNTSRHDVTTWSVPGPVSATNRHLTLTWRPGTLATAGTVGIAAPGWTMAVSPDRTTFHLLGPADTVIPAGASIDLPLTGLRPDGSDGTRATRVELGYRRLAHPGGNSELVGTRQQSLEVVNHRGRPDIPLDIGFVGGNQVLSTGTETSTLRLRVSNVSRQVAIPLTGSGTTNRGGASALVVSFDLQLANETRDWALTTSGQVDSVDVTLSGTTGVDWDVERLDEDERGTWTLTPKADTSIPADGWLELAIGPIHPLPTPGHSPLVLSYRNVPGFQDGFVSVAVERTPLLFSGSRLGIGTSAPQARLHIVAPANGADDGTLILGATNAPNLRLGHALRYSWVQSHGSTPLAINPIGNNVGIGTTDPLFRLTVDAVTEHLQLRRQTQSGGKQLFLELYQSETAANVVTYPSLRFHHAGKFWHRIEARAEGLLIKEGNLNSDELRDIFARAANLTTLRLGGTTLTEHELAHLIRLTRAFPI
ncbi:LamG domain-containing protein [Micromonospora sp. NPDC050397]|uniref:LamG domain-containing protein n=1 Tax=Micromonospora sp. NPDC050397 TaxID=3364279 RepID=UPI00384DC153